MEKYFMALERMHLKKKKSHAFAMLLAHIFLGQSSLGIMSNAIAIAMGMGVGVGEGMLLLQLHLQLM